MYILAVSLVEGTAAASPFPSPSPPTLLLSSVELELENSFLKGVRKMGGGGGGKWLLQLSNNLGNFKCMTQQEKKKHDTVLGGKFWGNTVAQMN